MSVEASSRLVAARGRVVLGIALAVVLALVASWVTRPAALAQGSMQAFPGARQVPIGGAPVSLIYTQKPGARISYKLTVLNDSPWSVSISDAKVTGAPGSGAFSATAVDLPKHREVAPGEEQVFVVHATFGKCLFPAGSATTNPGALVLVPGIDVSFRQFGVARSQLIDVRHGYAGIRTC